MTKLNTMYKGVVNSPETYLKENLAAEGAVIYVADGSVFGELPNLAVIGDDQTAETILVKVKRSDGGYDVDRAIEGQKKDWQKATVIARNFTNYDYKQLIDNINALNIGKVEKAQGKGLSTNDFTNEAKTKVDSIPSNPKYTDTTYEVATQSSSGLMSATDKVKVNNIPTNPKYTDTVTTINGKTGAISKADITALGIPAQDTVYDDTALKNAINGKADKGAIPTSLSQLLSDSTHRTVTDSEKNTWSGKQDKITKESVKALGFPEHVVLTQAQYDALSSTQKADTKVFYYIKKA